MKKIKFINSSPKNLYKKDIEFIKKISETRRNIYLKKKKINIRNWYRENRSNLNYIFKSIMEYFLYNGIFLDVKTQILYDEFIEFWFDNSYNNYKY